MATSKWKQVKVKVKGKTVTRWTDGKTFRLSKPGLKSGLRQAATSGLKKGDYNVGRTKQWDGKKYVPVNVTRAGQKATLNGKPVVADGKGNWRTPAPNSISGYGAKVGTYKPGNRTSGSKTTAPSRTVPKGSMNISAEGRKQAAANRAEAKAKREKAAAEEKKRLADQRAGSSNTPPTETKPPKPPATSSKKLTPMQQWAKNHKGLAKKITDGKDKGQAGYKDIKELKIGRSTKPRNWVEKNYKPGKKK